MADESGKKENESMLSHLQFSSGERDVIERVVTIPSSKPVLDLDFNNYYEVYGCVDIIRKHRFRKAALQFPDYLLGDSARVASLLEKETGVQTFVLADTSYGSCCVDEVAAEHVQADVIIHYGRTCLSKTQKLPVVFVFGKQQLSLDKCCKHFRKHFPEAYSNVLVMFDVVYSHQMDGLEKLLKNLYKNVMFSKLEYATKNGSLTLKTLSTKQDKGGDMENPKNIIAPKLSEVQTESSAGLDHDNKFCHQHSTEMEDMEIDHCEQCRFGRQFTLPSNRHLDDYCIFYIGEPSSLTLRNLMMSYNKCQFFTYDPETGESRKESLDVNRALMRRYFMIQKAKDAHVVGIVVGTLVVADYLKIIQRLKEILHLAGKKRHQVVCAVSITMAIMPEKARVLSQQLSYGYGVIESYLFVMGKLNVSKMANFMEIDVFVLVACPENTLIDTQEFYKPVVTPYEMEIACLRSREWTGDYVTDFRELLPGAAAAVDLEKEAAQASSDNVPDMSLITGNLRPTYPEDTGEDVTMSIVQRNQDTALSTQHHTTGAEFLAGRSWKGLEQNLGESPVTTATEGRKGIAAGYVNEQHLQ